MASCTKYHVIELYLKPKGAIELEDWLNERSEAGDEFLGVYEGKFIFKRNVYIRQIIRRDGNHDKLD